MENTDSKREMLSKGVMGFLVGASLLGAGIWTGRQLHIVWNIWPSTDGVVVRGTVQEVIQIPYAKRGNPIHNYTPRIEFGYTVNGKSYTTEAPSANNADTFDKAAAKLVQLYALGTHHPIRYNPRNPRDIIFGTIEFGPLVFSFLLLIPGVVLTAGGLNLLASGYWQRWERAPAKEPGTLPTVLPFTDRARVEPAAGTLRCPSCGRPVQAKEDSCPNCLKSLRAA